jgi:hypothetical protein
MVFCGNGSLERLFVHEIDDLESRHYIDIAMSKDDAIFSVTCCCDEEWMWEFWYSKTNYEVVKYLIMDSIAVCETMEELIGTLDELFEEDCADIVCYEAELQEDVFECDGDCENCSFNEDKYLH